MQSLNRYLVLFMVVTLAGCFGGMQPGPSSAQPEEKTSPEAWAALKKTYETNLTQCQATTERAPCSFNASM